MVYQGVKVCLDIEETDKSSGRNNARNETCMPERLFEHFKSEGNSSFVGNVSITFIDKTDGKDPKK